MSVKEYKPTSAGRRFMSGLTFDEITKKEPEKALLTPKKKTGGRNHSGKITTRHIGGGHKRRYRTIDFKRDKLEIPGKVNGIEYDPNRSANIALIHYVDGEKRYIIAPLGLKVGEMIVSSLRPDTEIKEGNALPLKFIPLGTFVHNVEMKPGKGGQLRAERWKLCAACCKRRRIWSCKIALRRSETGQPDMHGNYRPGGKY